MFIYCPQGAEKFAKKKKATHAKILHFIRLYSLQRLHTTPNLSSYSPNFLRSGATCK